MVPKQIDTRIALAVAMHANPGVYALLLGSGVSRSAQIPTGWEVVVDMIRRVAAASGEDCGSDTSRWYKEKFGEEPTYSGLLEAVGKSQAERSRLLKQYFDPSEEEREDGGKRPTNAHTAIAQLVRRGFVRVILTTNFDRLIERALENQGVAVTVINTPEAAEGAPPLVHCECTLVKLNGDYMDLRTRNTPDELAAYDSRIKTLLDRVLDEYGLIVCGWSADWDEALRKAIQRRKSRRFTTWWSLRGDLSESAKRLVTMNQAEIIPIEGADEFFHDLIERLSALDEFDRPHPISTKIAVAQTKKYLSESKYTIQLHDLIMREADRIADEITSGKYPVDGQFQDSEYARRIEAFDALSEIAIRILATGCYWDREKQHMETWLRAIKRVANAPRSVMSGNAWMLGIRRHPARLLLYAAGIAYAARNDLPSAYALLTGAKVREGNEESELALALVGDSGWYEVFKRLPGLERHKVPVSDHVYQVLRPAFYELLADETDYQVAFDMFEVLQSLHSADVSQWAIPSAFMYRTRGNALLFPLNRLFADVQESGDKSDFLRAGFCGGAVAKFTEAAICVQRMKQQIGW